MGSLGARVRLSLTFKGAPYKGTTRAEPDLSGIANDLEQVGHASPRLGKKVDCRWPVASIRIHVFTFISKTLRKWYAMSVNTKSPFMKDSYLEGSSTAVRPDALPQLSKDKCFCTASAGLGADTKRIDHFLVITTMPVRDAVIDD